MFNKTETIKDRDFGELPPTRYCANNRLKQKPSFLVKTPLRLEDTAVSHSIQKQTQSQARNRNGFVPKGKKKGDKTLGGKP